MPQMQLIVCRVQLATIAQVALVESRTRSKRALPGTFALLELLPLTNTRALLERTQIRPTSLHKPAAPRATRGSTAPKDRLPSLALAQLATTAQKAPRLRRSTPAQQERSLALRVAFDGKIVCPVRLVNTASLARRKALNAHWQLTRASLA